MKFNPYKTVFRLFQLCACVMLLTALTGCGSIIATVHLNHAERALESARLERAEELAIYEFVLAESYLEKAHEEWAHSDFQHANSYAKRAIISAHAGSNELFVASSEPPVKPRLGKMSGPIINK